MRLKIGSLSIQSKHHQMITAPRAQTMCTSLWRNIILSFSRAWTGTASLKLLCCRQIYLYFSFINTFQHFMSIFCLNLNLFDLNLLFINTPTFYVYFFLNLNLFALITEDSFNNSFIFSQARFKYIELILDYLNSEKSFLVYGLSIRNINIFCLSRIPVISSLLHYPAEKSSSTSSMVLELCWNIQEENWMH